MKPLLLEVVVYLWESGNGGVKLASSLKIWKTEEIPQDWKDASIVPVFRKGSRKDCGDYRGISPHSMAGKILARILFNSLTNT